MELPTCPSPPSLEGYKRGITIVVTLNIKMSCTCIKANVNLMQCEENFKAVSFLSICFLIDTVCCFFLRWRNVLATTICLIINKGQTWSSWNYHFYLSVFLSVCLPNFRQKKLILFPPKSPVIGDKQHDNSQTLLTVTPSGRNLSRLAWGMIKQSLPWAWLAISSSRSLWASSRVMGPRGRPRGGAGGPPPPPRTKGSLSVSDWRGEEEDPLLYYCRPFTELRTCQIHKNVTRIE